MVERDSATDAEISSGRLAAQYATAARQHAVVARQYAATARAYAESARGGASQYREAARDWAGPRVEVARERIAHATHKEQDKRGAAKVAAAVTAALPARFSRSTKATPLDRVKSQGGSALAAVRNRVSPPPPPASKKRGRLFLLLGIGSGAAAGWKAWSGRKQADEWDLPTYPSSNATVAGTKGGGTTATPGSAPAPLASDAAGASPGEALHDSRLERSMTDSSRTDRDPDTVDLPGDPMKDDGTAASTSPPSVRSEEGPGISDTDSAARRAQAGDAGAAGFDRADGSEGRSS